MAGAAGPEPVAVGFEAGFPFRFQRKGGERLLRSVFHGWNAEGTLFFGARFRDPDPTYWFRCVSEFEAGRESQPLGWGERFDAINPGGPFPAVILGDFSDREQFGRPGLHQEALEVVNSLAVTTT